MSATCISPFVIPHVINAYPRNNPGKLSRQIGALTGLVQKSDNISIAPEGITGPLSGSPNRRS